MIEPRPADLMFAVDGLGIGETVQDHIERLRLPPGYAPARHLVPALLPLHLPAATSAAPSCGWSLRCLARS